MNDTTRMVKILAEDITMGEAMVDKDNTLSEEDDEELDDLKRDAAVDTFTLRLATPTPIVAVGLLVPITTPSPYLQTWWVEARSIPNDGVERYVIVQVN